MFANEWGKFIFQKLESQATQSSTPGRKGKNTERSEEHSEVTVRMRRIKQLSAPAPVARMKNIPRQDVSAIYYERK